MAAYLASRIEKSKLNYTKVIEKYPALKGEIDEILEADGYKINEDGTVTK